MFPALNPNYHSSQYVIVLGADEVPNLLELMEMARRQSAITHNESGKEVFWVMFLLSPWRVEGFTEDGLRERFP